MNRRNFLRRFYFLFFLLSPALPGAPKTLEFYFVDVELGTATLIVSPSGESMLIDTGSSGNNGRDANRVLAAVKQAGLRKIDYLVVTHFQDDHYGATSELAGKIPIRNFVDHGSSVEFGKDAAWHKRWMMGNQDELWVAYGKARQTGHHMLAKPGARIPFKGMDALVVTSAGERISKPLKGAGAANPACAHVEPKSPDEIEDGQSVGVLITFGKFRFIHLGDLTWNKANELFCPHNLVGTVDVYEATHHAVRVEKSAAPVMRGRDCCSEAEVHGLRPRVALISCGPKYHPRGTPDGWRAIRHSPGLEDIWQTHFQIQGGTENNASEQFIANLSAENCQAHGIKLSVKPDGSFTMTNSRNGYTKPYQPHTR